MMQWLKRLLGFSRPERITKEEIEQLPPAKLCRKFINGELASDIECAVFDDIMCAVELDAEVVNGGFNQYYYNSDGERAERARSTFTRLGADQVADVVKRANERYVICRDELHSLWATGTKKGFFASYKKAFFDTFDSEYYALMRNYKHLYELIGMYIKQHPQEFLNTQQYGNTAGMEVGAD